MQTPTTYRIKSFDKGIKEHFVNFLKFNISNKRLIPFFIKTLYHQKRGFDIRKKNLKENLQIPSVLALSITSNCNLNCVGCYYKSADRSLKNDLSDYEIKRIIQEAHDLGVRIMLVLGGEPFTKDIFELTRGFSDMIFVVYTNSTLIDQATVKKLHKHHNIIPVLSLEGYSGTDNRRGTGILKSIREAQTNFKTGKIIYGLSYTITRENFDEIVNDTVIREDIENACAFFNFFEYMPIDSQTRHLMLLPEQKSVLTTFTTAFRDKYKKLILSPILETKVYGGCMGGGKEVAHINSDGYLEPCPFIAVSDTNVRNMSLKEAFGSPLLSKIRKHLPEMAETKIHSCKLFSHRENISNNEWDKVVAKVKMYAEE